MTIALVGAVGAVVQSASGSAPSGLAFGTGETPTTLNDLLVCWWQGNGSATVAATPAGWSPGPSLGGTSCAAAIFYKVAAGSDSAPSFSAITSSVQSVQLAEFSGAAIASPLDKSGSASGTAASMTVACSAADATPSELVLVCSGGFYTTAATRTLADSLNNGATVTDTTNNAAASADHYCFGYATTTGNSVADSDSWTTSTSTHLTGAVGVIASFKALVGPVIPQRTLMGVGV